MDEILPHNLSPEQVRAERLDFPITEQCIYLDHAAISPIPRTVGAAMSQQISHHISEIHIARSNHNGVVTTAKQNVARLINANLERIAFTQNTSHGISLVANGLSWKEGDNVVVPAREFPSNLLSWKRLEKLGVEVRLVDIPDGKCTAAALSPWVDAKTRLISLSHVQFYNGYRCDLASISELAHRHDAMLVVDGTQSAGACVIDFAGTGIDALAVSAHKWMMGPLGIGFLAFSDRMFEALDVVQPGWLSVNSPFEFRRELDYLPDAGRFESGTENFAGIYGLCARVSTLLDLGMENVEGRVMYLNLYLREILKQAGYSIQSPEAPQVLSGIICFNSQGGINENTPSILAENNIFISMRNGALRASPHYYNSEDELDALVSCLSGIR